MDDARTSKGGTGFYRIAWSAMNSPRNKRRGRPKGDGPVRETVVALKGAPEWKEWLDEFAAHCRLGLADTIEQALLAYARDRDFREPPKR